MKKYGRWIWIILCLTFLCWASYIEPVTKADFYIGSLALILILKEVIECAWEENYGEGKEV